MKGKILIINPGSTSTKIGFYEDGKQLFETNLTHSAEEIARYESVMDQGAMRREAIEAFLSDHGVAVDSIDLIMARGGLITPIKAGVYEVTPLMREALVSGKDGNLPVFILDGLEVSAERIYDMDVTRIKSMTILKDAAATAIYGSRASNGVVVVETVPPMAGKIHVSYNLTGSITAPD